MKGIYGRILHVDLGRRAAEIREPGEAFFAAHPGGKALGTRLLLDETPPGADPMGPDNRLIITTGPLAGSRIWGNSRYGVYTKSPLTGIYCESYSGGRAPLAVDGAGYDAVVVSGRADGLIALRITPEGCTFHDAADMAGMDCMAAEEQALERWSGQGRSGALVVGPAAENGVRFSIIANDRWRCAGRAGAGAVLGAKNVKALVFSGGRRRELADPEGAAAHARAFLKEHGKGPAVAAYKGWGTPGMLDVMGASGAFPCRYWTQGDCAHRERINAAALHELHDVTPHACPTCFLACGRMTRVRGGRHDGLKLDGPEYETIFAFGGLAMVEDLGEIAHLNDLCDRLGMDTITGGSLCAFAMEARERGKLDFPIAWGDADACEELLRLMAARTGPGEIFAHGVVPAARALGMEDAAVHVKGLDPAGYDPRVYKGIGLGYAVSDRGACHVRTTFYKAELAGMVPADSADTEKAELLVDFEDRLALFDCLILCRFFRDLYGWDELAQVMRLATGLDATPETLKDLAARTANMTREFNLREGMDPAADRLPDRLHQPLPSGARITRDDLDAMLDGYYAKRGWKRGARE